MKTSHIAFTLGLALASAPTFAQSATDIDAQIQRLKGIPGREEAVKQLEAHRAEIQKAENAAPKQDTGPRTPVDIEPVKSFSGIPEPPRTALEAFKRYGQWSVNGGADTPCDIQTRDLHTRMAGWMQALNEHALRYAPTGASGVLVGQGPLMTELGDTAIRLDAELKAREQQFHSAANASKARYLAKLKQVETTYGAKINACLDANSHAGGSSCDYLYREQDDALVAAGAPFLSDYNGLCADYRAKLHDIAAEGQSLLDKARKTLGDKVPPYADSYFTHITTTSMVALGDAVDAEDQATVIVHDQTQSRVWSDDAKRLGLSE